VKPRTYAQVAVSRFWVTYAKMIKVMYHTRKPLRSGVLLVSKYMLQTTKGSERLSLGLEMHNTGN